MHFLILYYNFIDSKFTNRIGRHWCVYRWEKRDPLVFAISINCCASVKNGYDAWTCFIHVHCFRDPVKHSHSRLNSPYYFVYLHFILLFYALHAYCLYFNALLFPVCEYHKRKNIDLFLQRIENDSNAQFEYFFFIRICFTIYYKCI